MAGQKRRIAQAIDPTLEAVNLATLRDLVQTADRQGFRDDSTFEIYRPEGPFGITYLVLNEVTP